jgi:hypothetical protein
MINYVGITSTLYTLGRLSTDCTDHLILIPVSTPQILQDG